MNTLVSTWLGHWHRLRGHSVHNVLGWRVWLERHASEREAAALLSRLERVLAMVTAAMPGHLEAMREHVTQIRVIRFPCRGAFIATSRDLIIERTFLADPARFDAEIAATLVHEGEHARLRGSGLAETMTLADEERMCRAVEIALGERVPGGERVLERAHAAMQLADTEVAPEVDWNEAWRNVDVR